MPSSIRKQLLDNHIEPRNIEMHLRFEETVTQHNCIFCKRGIFRSHNRVISVNEVAGYINPFLTAPVSIQCPTCGTIYHLSTFNQ